MEKEMKSDVEIAQEIKEIAEKLRQLIKEAVVNNKLTITCTSMEDLFNYFIKHHNNIVPIVITKKF